jgi:hypothetical protein
MDATTLLNLHTSWAWVVIIGNALAGVWALSAHKVIALRSRALWWFTAFTQFSIFVHWSWAQSEGMSHVIRRHGSKWLTV